MDSSRLLSSRLLSSPLLSSPLHGHGDGDGAGDSTRPLSCSPYTKYKHVKQKGVD
jgi:hypothetical protein